VDDMKIKNNLNVFKRNSRKLMGELRRGQILTKHWIQDVFFKLEFCTDVTSEQ